MMINEITQEKIIERAKEKHDNEQLAETLWNLLELRNKKHEGTADERDNDFYTKLRKAFIGGIRISAEKQKADKAAHFDILTGLLSRPGLLALRDSETISQTGNVAVVFLDIDNFGEFNKKHGHDVGDAVLKYLASQIKTNIRNRDIAARFGGEEIVIFLPGATIDDANNIFERIREKITKFEVKTENGPITLSIGFSAGISSIESIVLYKAIHSGNFEKITEAIKEAEKLMRKAKKVNSKKNQTFVQSK